MAADAAVRRLTLRELQILLAVARAGSMAKAAREVGLSQPGVSRAVADLEQTLGVPLFDRTPRGIEPTRYGRVLLRRGVAVFDELEQGVQEIAQLANPGEGELRIGCSASLSESIVLASVEKLSRKFPRTVFHVMPGGALALHEDLRERRIELGFARLPGTDPADDVHAELLFEEPLVVVAGAANPLARRREIGLAELLDEPWTWPPPGTMADAFVRDAFRAAGLEPPRARVYAEAVNMRTRLAATGAYLAVVPASVLRFHADQDVITRLPVDLPMTRTSIGIITLKNRTLSPLAQLLIDCAREIAATLAEGGESCGSVSTAARSGAITRRQP